MGYSATASNDGNFHLLLWTRLKNTVTKFALPGVCFVWTPDVDYFFIGLVKRVQQHGQQCIDHKKNIFSTEGPITLRIEN